MTQLHMKSQRKSPSPCWNALALQVAGAVQGLVETGKAIGQVVTGRRLLQPAGTPAAEAQAEEEETGPAQAVAKAFQVGKGRRPEAAAAACPSQPSPVSSLPSAALLAGGTGQHPGRRRHGGGGAWGHA